MNVFTRRLSKMHECTRVNTLGDTVSAVSTPLGTSARPTCGALAFRMLSLRDTLRDEAPKSVPPSSSFEAARFDGAITPEFAPLETGACVVCFESPRAQTVEDVTFPCCGACTHLCCFLHGQSQLPCCDRLHLRARCLVRPLRTALRMRSSAITRSGPSPPPIRQSPLHIRAVCCRRLAEFAMGFVELPDARMHWSPVPHRHDRGIASWHSPWIYRIIQALPK